MDSPNFSGLGIKLQRVLEALDINNLEPPSWTLKDNKGKIYLDICWVKLKSPATTAVSSTRINTCDQVKRGSDILDKRGVECPPHCDKKTANTPLESSIVPPRRRKKKSPSTQKRDRQRLVKWLDSKRSRETRLEAILKPNSVVPPVKTTSPPDEQSLANVPLAACSLGNQAAAAPDPFPVKPSSDSHDSQCHGRTDSSQVKQTQEVSIDTEPISDEELDLDLCANTVCMIPGYLAPGGLKKCTRCYMASYCSRNCQAQHWKFHKLDCFKP